MVRLLPHRYESHVQRREVQDNRTNCAQLGLLRSHIWMMCQEPDSLVVPPTIHCCMVLPVAGLSLTIFVGLA